MLILLAAVAVLAAAAGAALGILTARAHLRRDSPLSILRGDVAIFFPQAVVAVLIRWLMCGTGAVLLDWAIITAAVAGIFFVPVFEEFRGTDGAELLRIFALMPATVAAILVGLGASPLGVKAAADVLSWSRVAASAYLASLSLGAAVSLLRSPWRALWYVASKVEETLPDERLRNRAFSEIAKERWGDFRTLDILLRRRDRLLGSLLYVRRRVADLGRAGIRTEELREVEVRLTREEAALESEIASLASSLVEAVRARYEEIGREIVMEEVSRFSQRGVLKVAAAA